MEEIFVRTEFLRFLETTGGVLVAEGGFGSDAPDIFLGVLSLSVEVHVDFIGRLLVFENCRPGVTLAFLFLIGVSSCVAGANALAFLI